MAQYKTGSVQVTQGQTGIVGTGTAWLGEIAPGNMFAITGENVWYKVLAVVDNTHITLDSAYSATSKTGQAYQIHRDFTTSRGFAIPAYGDTDTASLIAQSLQDIDAELAALAPINALLNGDITITGSLNLSLVNRTPASSSAAGSKGDFCFDADFLYVCVATNSWKRSSLSTW